MNISKTWSMPNPNTFSIKPIEDLIKKYIRYGVIVDPFARDSKFGTITNDLDETMPTTYHMDALDFLKMLPDDTVDMILYDPPYSSRQVAECYKKHGRSVMVAASPALPSIVNSGT